MARAHPGRRRLDKLAMGRSLLVLLGLALLAAACTGQRGGRAAAAAWEEWDDDDGRGGGIEENYTQRRQEAMEEAARAFSGYDPATTPPGTIERAMATVNREIGHLRPVTVAISGMPERTAAQVRAKEDARAAFNHRLSRHLGRLLPGASVKITSEPGRTFAELSGGTYKTSLLLNDAA